MFAQKKSSASPPAIIHVPSKEHIEEKPEQGLSKNFDLLKGERRRYHHKTHTNSEIIIAPIVGVTASLNNHGKRVNTPDTEEPSAQSFFDPKKNIFVEELKYVYRRLLLLNCVKKPKKRKFERAAGCLT